MAFDREESFRVTFDREGCFKKLSTLISSATRVSYISRYHDLIGGERSVGGASFEENRRSPSSVGYLEEHDDNNDGGDSDEEDCYDDDTREGSCDRNDQDDDDDQVVARAEMVMMGRIE